MSLQEAQVSECNAQCSGAKRRPLKRREAPRRPAEGGAKRRPAREALRAGEQAKQEPTETRSKKAWSEKTKHLTGFVCAKHGLSFCSSF